MFKLYGLLVIGALCFGGCASAPKAELENQNPKDAIGEVEQIRLSALRNQADLLAHNSFKNGEDKFSSGVNASRDGDNESGILDDLSQAKAYFIESKAVANNRAVVPTRILSAREATLNNGVRESSELNRKLKKIDKSLRDNTEDFSRRLSVEVFSKFEKDYLDLEIKSVQNTELKVFRDILKSAENKEAPDLAPKTYNTAKSDLRAAENMIQQSPRNSENYEDSVLALDKSAKLLSDVMSKLTGVATGASEQAALKLVYQERALGNLSDRVDRLQGTLSRSQSDLSQVSGKLESKTSEAKQSASKVRIQNAMNEVRSNFSNDEAEVYQQGSDLIIRLKKINFNSGSAMIPSKSMGLLSKVNTIVEKLSPEEVVVQGHTDSIGKNSSNQKLSMKRSEAVAKYLKSLKAEYKLTSKGYGESNPIANNETKQGRSMNRRVDIVVSTGSSI